jgi:hypothetical protein
MIARIHILITSFGLLCTGALSAQSTREEVKQLLLRVQSAYQHASYLDFRVTYTYANLDRPGQSIDSLSGEVQLDKVRARVVMPGSETLVNASYSIQVLEKDKIVYISKAPVGIPVNPTGSVDSVLKYLDQYQVNISEAGGEKVLMIGFPEGGRFSRVRMQVDTLTGYLKEMTYFLKTEGLISRDQLKSAGHGGSYQAEGLVQISFSGYKSGGFSDTAFATDQYFTKTNGQYEPADRFKGYHLFWATSPN